MTSSLANKSTPFYRHLTEHQVNPVNDLLTVRVLDLPGHGGACHHYHIWGPLGVVDSVVSFQNGPINENGLNGVTHEVLLAIIADRLRSFQDGPYRCDANDRALTHIESAQYELQSRTRERLERGVEGTHQV